MRPPETPAPPTEFGGSLVEVVVVILSGPLGMLPQHLGFLS